MELPVPVMDARTLKNNVFEWQAASVMKSVPHFTSLPLTSGAEAETVRVATLYLSLFKRQLSPGEKNVSAVHMRHVFVQQL